MSTSLWKMDSGLAAVRRPGMTIWTLQPSEWPRITPGESRMPSPLPALNLIAPPGRRHATLEMAREIERRGFAGISVSSSFANMAQCTGLAFGTERITFATAIAPIYAETVEEFAHGAAYIHEISGRRFQFGIGVAHGPK